MFLLTTLSVAYVIYAPRQEEKEEEIVEEMCKRAKRDNDDFICRGHILNYMVDSILDIYQYVKPAKKLWNMLDGKYIAVQATSKKFLVSRFNDYKFVDCRHIQFHEMQ